MHLKIRQLEVFHAVLDCGSVSRAAERLNLSQPAVSLSLASLESELGFALFHRSRGYFAPTAEAMLLVPDTERSLLSLERVRSRARLISEGALGSITIASNGAAALNLLPPLIADYQSDHPNVSINLMVRSSRRIATWTASRQIDIGLIDAPVPVSGVVSTIFRLPCVCVLREDDPLASERRITPKMFEGRSVVAITGDHPIDRRIDAMCLETGVNHKRLVTCGYFAIARNLVRDGVGLAVIDPINGNLGLADGVVSRPFEPEVSFELALIRPDAESTSKPLQTFVDRLMERLSKFTG